MHVPLKLAEPTPVTDRLQRPLRELRGAPGGHLHKVAMYRLGG